MSFRHPQARTVACAPVQRGSSTPPGKPQVEKAVEIAKIPLDIASYKLYYVNYKIGAGFALCVGNPVLDRNSSGKHQQI